MLRPLTTLYSDQKINSFNLLRHRSINSQGLRAERNPKAEQNPYYDVASRLTLLPARAWYRISGQILLRSESCHVLLTSSCLELLFSAQPRVTLGRSAPPALSQAFLFLPCLSILLIAALQVLGLVATPTLSPYCAPVYCSVCTPAKV